MPRQHRAPQTTYRPLVVLCLAFTILVALHTAATPIFEAPDEVWHYAYVRWVAEGNGLPPLDEDLSGAYQEAAQPPLYYLVAALVSAPFDDQDLDDVTWGNPGFGHQAPGTEPDNKNMLIHTPDEAVPWRGTALTLHATRLTSWAFGTLTVIAVWGLGYETFRSRKLATITAALIAFHPQFVFLSSVVNNDSAAAAIATGALWLGARIVNRGTTRYRAVSAGILGGLAILTKTSTLPVVPMLSTCLILSALWDRERGSRTFWDHAPAQLLLQLGITAVLGGWWYLRNTSLYGDPMGLSSHTQTQWGRAEPAKLLELLPELPLLLRSFWAAYGWGHITWPDWVYIALWMISLPLLSLGVLVTVRAWLRMTKQAEGLKKLLTQRPSTASWMVPAAIAVCWFAGIAAALLRWMQQVEAPHGRLLFPAIGAWALLLTLGLQQIRQERPRAGRHCVTLLLGTSAILVATAPGARILATFSPPRLQSADAIVGACTNPISLQVGDFAKLICAEASPKRVSPGDQVTIRACWESLAPTTENLTVFTHLIGPEGTRPAERHTYPGLGRYPTSLWTPGTAFCDSFALSVEPWAETPVRYQLEIGLFDSESGARLPAKTTSGHSVAPPVVGTVDVVPDQVTPEMIGLDFIPSVGIANFGAPQQFQASLLFADTPAIAVPGDDIDITLHWRADSTNDTDYVTFIHLWEPEFVTPLAQHDSQPRNGWFPTSAWRDNDYIPDQHTLHLPEDVQPGTYRLWAGLYNPADGNRVAAYGTPGRFDHNMVPLGKIEIRSSP